jgi:ABC-type Fe3+-hydroxamate transport system substrate-binding protein
MKEYQPDEIEALKKRMNGVMEALGKADFYVGAGIGNNYPSFVFEYDGTYEPFVEKAVRDLEDHVKMTSPHIQVARVHLFEFAREFLQAQGKWEKSLELERTKGEDFLFVNLPKTLNGKVIADFFLEKIQLLAPGLILIHGVGMAYPILRGHEILKNLPERLSQKIPIIMFYPGEYDGKYLKPFGMLTDTNEYQAMRWNFS